MGACICILRFKGGWGSQYRDGGVGWAWKKTRAWTHAHMALPHEESIERGRDLNTSQLLVIIVMMMISKTPF